ncbi:MAG: M56 family metallopeptidase [Planctomycetota bacterium]|nr:M56 family metallopeptidase [Planctomycetota bacterium]MDA1114545.1 M56 family metallopeptidase [Planctomycetota bacterium]
MSDFILLVGSWLLTFLLHSTVWLGLALLLLRQFPSFTPVVRDWIWKGVILGSLLSPTFQVSATTWLGWDGFGSQLTLTSPNTAAASMLEEVAVTPMFENAEGNIFTLGPYFVPDTFVNPEQNQLAIMLAAAPLIHPGVWPEADGAMLATTASMDQPGQVIPLWLKVLLSIWVVGAWVGLTYWILAVLRLRKQLANRLPLTTGSLVRNIQKDLARFGTGRSRRIRFSLSDQIQVPVAFGILRGEVCLPMRALQELDSEQQQTMLGHELAHLLRRDPLWLNLFQFTQRILFMQPLLFFARREAFHAAEEICDAWAIHRSGNRVALAECLTIVAQWLRPGSRTLPVACMAQPGSPLGRRVHRLLDQEAEVAPRNAAVRGSIALGLVTILTSMAMFAPQVVGHFRAPITSEARADLLALEADWGLAEDRIAFLHLEIAALRQEMALGVFLEENDSNLHQTLNNLQLQLQRLEQLSDHVRWNIQTQN